MQGHYCVRLGGSGELWSFHVWCCAHARWHGVWHGVWHAVVLAFAGFSDATLQPVHSDGNAASTRPKHMAFIANGFARDRCSSDQSPLDPSAILNVEPSGTRDSTGDSASTPDSNLWKKGDVFSAKANAGARLALAPCAAGRSARPQGLQPLVRRLRRLPSSRAEAGAAERAERRTSPETPFL